MGSAETIASSVAGGAIGAGSRHLVTGGRRWIAAALVAFALLATASAEARVPQGFFGVVPQGPLSPEDYDRVREVAGTLRVPFYWSQLEPSPGTHEFSATDSIVSEAADRGIRVLPFVYGSPHWLTGDPALPPQGTAHGRAAWKSFLRRLVRRYGPRGTFWSGWGRRVPIRRWQIWNEPNFPLFWRPGPSPRGYAHLLRAAARAIRGEDRGARIITAGLAPVEGGPLPWSYLRRLYHVPGVRRSFDVVGLHPYAGSLHWLEYQASRIRNVMRAAGDRTTPLAVTEFGVASDGLARSPMVKSAPGQAAFLRRAFAFLIDHRRRWRLSGVAWYSWQDGPNDRHCVFCQYAGLFDITGEPKPSWWAFRRASSGSQAHPVR